MRNAAGRYSEAFQSSYSLTSISPFSSCALGIEVERIHTTNPRMSGVRTEDIKTEIIAEQTGRKVSGKTIQREEAMARAIENDLSEEWKPLANSGEISAAAVRALADLSAEEQSEIRASMSLEGLNKRQRTDATIEAVNPETRTSKLLLQAQKSLDHYNRQIGSAATSADLACITSIKKTVNSIKVQLTKSLDTPSKVS